MSIHSRVVIVNKNRKDFSPKTEDFFVLQINLYHHSQYEDDAGDSKNQHHLACADFIIFALFVTIDSIVSV